MTNAVFAALFVASITSQSMSAPKPQTAPPTESSPQAQPTPEAESLPVVVELFTSEGCSSCPRADHVASQIVGASRDKNTRVIVLSFHVDYWDYLGWPDRFSSKAATDRQREYAGALGNRGLYTPQMVVGGRREFVGSDSPRANHEITKAKTQTGKVTLTTSAAWKTTTSTREKPTPTPTADASKTPPTDLEVVLTVKEVAQNSPSTGEMRYLAAIVEDGLESKVTRGENAGHTLKHDAVVRAFQSGTISSKPLTVALTLPKDVNHQRARVVTLVQDAKTFAVLAAGESQLPDAPAADPAAKPSTQIEPPPQPAGTQGPSTAKP